MKKIKEFLEDNIPQILILIIVFCFFGLLLFSFTQYNKINNYIERRQKSLELSNYNITYEIKEMPSDTRWTIVIDDSISSAMILINKNLELSEQQEVVNHELVHLLIHDSYLRSDYEFEELDPKVEESMASKISNICK